MFCSIQRIPLRWRQELIQRQIIADDLHHRDHTLQQSWLVLAGGCMSEARTQSGSDTVELPQNKHNLP